MTNMINFEKNINNFYNFFIFNFNLFVKYKNYK